MRLTRRRRLLLLTSAGAFLFFVAGTVAALRWRDSGQTYRPGEDSEGITTELARDLPDNYPHVTFTDVTRLAGIEFQHFSGKRSSQLPEDMGSGAAWGDYDNDGWVDLVVTNEVGPLTMSDDARLMQAIAEIAYIAGLNGYATEDSRTAIHNFVSWATEFETHRSEDAAGNETYFGKDYMTAVEEFTLHKIAEGSE